MNIFGQNSIQGVRHGHRLWAHWQGVRHAAGEGIANAQHKGSLDESHRLAARSPSPWVDPAPQRWDRSHPRANDSCPTALGVDMTPVVTDVDVLEAAVSWSADGHAVVLATVVETWGSAPRRAGSHLAIRGDQRFVGSVSGGCVEGAVVREAMQALSTRQSRTVTYGVADADAWEVGLACGGRITVLITPLDTAAFAALRACVQGVHRRELVGLWMPLDGGVSCIHDQSPAEQLQALRAGERSARCSLVDTAQGPIFVRPLPPPVRVLVIGAVHISAALVPMLSLLGHQVVVVDPRRGFGPPESTDAVPVLRGYPDEVFPQVGLDPRTAVVALTHDPKIDDPGLVAAMASKAFYIGALGSKKTHAKRLIRLAQQGIRDSDLRRIHGPIGLNIHAATPAEIAVSIVGELTAVLRANT